MPQTNEALVNDVLNEAAHLLSDVGLLYGVPPESEERKGFSVFSKLFCDSIIFWGIYNCIREDTKGTAIGKYKAELQDAFNQSGLEVDSVKPAYDGHVDVDDEYFSNRTLKYHRKQFHGKPYEAGYIAIKVSLDYCRVKRVVPI